MLSPDGKRYAIRALALLVLWSLPPLLNAVQMAVDARIMNRPFSYLSAVWMNYPRWILWVAFTPAIVWIVRRVPVLGGSIRRRALVHGGAVIAATLLITACWVLTMRYSSSEWRAGTVDVFTMLVPVSFLWSVALYTAIGAATMAVDARRREAKASMDAARLKTQLVESRLDSLRRQMQPHFFFNTLHTISGLVRTNRNAEAVRMIARLGDLMREAMVDANGQETSLRRELELLELYLEIQRIRFEDRLQVRVEVADDTMNAQVPVLLLQPLAENAVDHGISNQPGGGWLELQSRRDGDHLLITMRNSGGIPDAVTNKGGIGLQNTRERLRTLYGEAASLELRGEVGEAVAAIVRIPFRALAAV